MSGTSIPYRYAVLYAFQKQEWISQTHQRAQEIAVQLRTRYTSNPFISLLIPQERKQIPIEKLYTRLAIIGEAEQKEKKKEVEQAYPGQDPFGYGIIPTHESIFEPKEAIDLENILNRGPLKKATEKRVLVQGSAGIGKTTLCHHIAYRWAQGELFQEFDYLFWLPLRNLSKEHYSKKSTLADYLAQECGLELDEICFFLKDSELQKKSLFLLDGYDELSSDAVNPRGCFYPILEELKAFPHLLMTTRPQLVNLGPKPLCRLEILGFDAEGVKEYIDRFFSEKEESQAQKMRRSLRQPLIRSLSRIPINLEIFCSLAAIGEPLLENPTMTTLYIQLTDWLFKRFRIERSSALSNPSDAVEESDPRHAEEVDPLAQALEEIAWEAMKQNKLYLPESQITHIFRTVDRHIQLGDMRRIGPLRIEEHKGVFIHLTFQEFFAAAYLVHLYENHPKEAQKQLKEIKFEPRYQLVLSMTAGYLSHLSKKRFLQTFFNDLFSEPIDLAISYGLRFQSRCFEECQDPEGIAQYKSFIEQIIRYLREHPNKRLKEILLTENTRLLSNEKVARLFIDSLQDEMQEMNWLELLTWPAQRGQMIPNSILSFLATNTISTTRRNSKAKEQAIQILQEVARNGHNLPEETLPVLISILTNPELDSNIKSSATNALGEVAKSNQQPLAQETLTALFSLATNPEADFDAKSSAINALGEIIDSNQPVAQEALTALIRLLTNPEGDFSTQDFAVEAQGEVPQVIQTLSKELLTALISLATDPEADFCAQGLAVSVLGEVALSGQPLAQEALTALISLVADPMVTPSTYFAVIILGDVSLVIQTLPKELLTALISLATNPEADSDVKSSAAKALRKVAQSGQPLAKEALVALIHTLKNLEADSDVKSSAAKALRKVAQSGQLLAKEALTALIHILKDPEVDSDAKSIAAQALGEMAESGQNLSEEAPTALIYILKDPEADPDVKSIATFALGNVPKSGQTLPEEALTVLISLLTNSEEDFDGAKLFAAGALREVAKSGQTLPDEALTALISLVTNPEAADGASCAADALGEAAKGGQTLPEEALTALITLLTHPEASSWEKCCAADALGKVAKGGQVWAKEALTALISLVTNSQVDFDIKLSAAEALGDVGKSGQTLPEEALTVLICILTDSRADYPEKRSVAGALREVAKSDHPLAKEALTALISLATDPNPTVEFLSKAPAIKALRKVAESGQPFHEEALTALVNSLKYSNSIPHIIWILEIIAEGQSYRLSHQPSSYKLLAKLCFLTGQAFFLRGDQFHITKRQEIVPLEIKAEIDPKKLYEEILLDQYS